MTADAEHVYGIPYNSILCEFYYANNDSIRPPRVV